MTQHQKNSKVAAKSNQKEQSHEEKMMHVVKTTAHNIVALLMTALWFVAIGLVAAGLGWGVHMAEEVFTWMPHWMLETGHILEGVLFVLDCLGFLWSVIKHFWDQINHH